MSEHDTRRAASAPEFDQSAMNRAIDKVLAFEPQKAAAKRQPRRNLAKRDRQTQNGRQPNTAKA